MAKNPMGRSSARTIDVKIKRAIREYRKNGTVEPRLRKLLCFLQVGGELQDITGLHSGGLGGALIELDGVARRAVAGDAGQVIGFHGMDGNNAAVGGEVENIKRDSGVLHTESTQFIGTE